MLARIIKNEFCRLARARECDVPHALPDEMRKQRRRFGVGAAPRALDLVHDGWIPQRKFFRAVWRAVLAHDLRGARREAHHVFFRIRNRRRAKDKLRAIAVQLPNAEQTPQHACHLRAEDTAVDVRLVNHDVTQIPKEFRPEIVIRQNADGEHVGIRQDDVRGLAELGADCARRIAIIRSKEDAIFFQRLG